jgi:radical SAM superfamily enzyme YgiQ (UPF0313 family)
MTVLHFIDDSFGANREWLVELVRALLAKRGSSVALQANIRADLVTDELCAALGEYGADKLRLRIAVETGNEEYRRRILKKNISDEELVGAADPSTGTESTSSRTTCSVFPASPTRRHSRRCGSTAG